MRYLLTPLALATFALAAAPSFAEDSDTSCGSAPQSQWMTVEALTAKFVADGYEVRQVKIEDGCYEIYAKDQSGMKVEAYVNPVTGAMIASKADD